MAKLALSSALFALATMIGLAASSQSASAAKPCARTAFKTEAVKAACAAGGQASAKDDMKKFLAKAKKTDSSLTCKSCHSSLAPKYDLKADGLERYKKLGGK
ncbi:MAG: hypothetical protein R2939_16510 [Kofleriaceae bacterium]